MYTTYIKGYDNAVALYHDQINNNMKFSQLVKEFEVSFQHKLWTISGRIYSQHCGGAMV